MVLANPLRSLSGITWPGEALPARVMGFAAAAGQNCHSMVTNPVSRRCWVFIVAIRSPVKAHLLQ
jgi:hypothetical protein